MSDAMMGVAHRLAVLVQAFDPTCVVGPEACRYK